MARTLIRLETQTNNDNSSGTNWFLRADGSVALEGDLSAANTHTITNLPDPSLDGDAANKGWVNSQISDYIQGLDVKESVRVATTQNISLSTPPATIDGVTMANGERVLVKNQTDDTENGFYIYNSGGMTRSNDADETDELSGGTFAFVEEGGGQANSGWVVTANGSLVPGTDSVTFSQFSGAGSITAGDGLVKNGNSIDFVAADSSLTVGANNVAVNAGNGLTVGTGLEVNSHTGITVDGNGVSVNLTGGTGIDVSGATISTASDVLLEGDMGTGLTVTTGTVSLDNTYLAGIYLEGSDVGDGLTGGTSGFSVQAADVSIGVGASGVSVNAGDGLIVGGSALDVNPGDGIQIVGDAVAVTADVVRDSDISDMYTKTEFDTAIGDGLTGDNTGFSVSTTVIRDSDAGAGLVLNGTSGAFDVNPGTGIQIDTDTVAVNLTGGTGITVSGADIAIDDTVVVTHTDTTNIAGAGLTGDETGIDVVGGNGITVNANDVVANIGDGLEFQTGAIAVDNTVARTGDLTTFARDAFTGGGGTTGFTLSNTPASDSELVYVNGQFQARGAGNDYTISGTSITFQYSPRPGASIQVVYAQ